MQKRLVLVLFFICGYVLCVPAVFASDAAALVRLLIRKGIITQQELDAISSELESERAVMPTAKVPEVTQEQKQGLSMPVMMARTGSSLKMSGRFAAGYVHGGTESNDPSGAFRMPDAKIQFAFAPDSINSIVMRMSLNNAAFNSLDYLYLESKDFLAFLQDYPIGLTTRLGRIKMDFGEETWSNNPIEGALISTSVGNVSGHDEGAQLLLSGKTAWSPKLTLGIFNGNSGSGTDNTTPKAYLAKLSVTPLDSFYLSSSYFDSRALKGGASEFTIGGVTSAPTGAANWSRKAWEVDARYDIKKGKAPLNPPVYTDSLAYLRAAYGLFEDDAKGSTSRNGDYGFIEALWNLHPKVYAAWRWSMLDFDQELSAAIGRVAGVKRQQRHSIGAGYRWSKNTIIKAEWSIDHESGTDDRANNTVSIVASSQF